MSLWSLGLVIMPNSVKNNTNAYILDAIIRFDGADQSLAGGWVIIAEEGTHLSLTKTCQI
jgi:hypothetical protein